MSYMKKMGYFLKEKANELFFASEKIINLVNFANARVNISHFEQIENIAKINKKNLKQEVRKIKQKLNMKERECLKKIDKKKYDVLPY